MAQRIAPTGLCGISLGRVLIDSVHVRFTPKATQLLCEVPERDIPIPSTDYERSVSRLLPMLRDARVARSSA